MFLTRRCWGTARVAIRSAARAACGAGRRYVLGVADTMVFAPETGFEGNKGRQKTRPRPDRKPEAIGALIARQDDGAADRHTFRDGPDGEPMTASCGQPDPPSGSPTAPADLQVLERPLSNLPTASQH